MRLPAAFAPLMLRRARYKIFRSGRGVAKTHSFATALIARVSQRGERWLCCREIQRSMKESVKRVLDLKIDQMGLNHRFHSTANQISCDNGGWLGFEGLRNNIDNIRSYEDLDGVWLEEAATVSQSSLDILIPTIRKPGSEIWASYNPRFPTDPIDKLATGSLEQDSEDFFREMAQKTELGKYYDEWVVVRSLQISDNPFFPITLAAEMERDRRRDPDRYAHIWLGQYARMSASRVFHNWKVGTMEVPEGHRPHYGVDWGFSIDPTVGLRIYVFPATRTLYIDREVSKVGCPIDKTPALLDDLDEGAMRKWPAKADSSRPETINYMKSHGYPNIVGARKGPGSVEEGVEFLKNWDIIVHPNCKGVATELSLYSYEIDKQTNEVLPELADKHNHFIDALRYAVEDLRRGGKILIPLMGTAARTFFGDHPGI